MSENYTNLEFNDSSVSFRSFLTKTFVIMTVGLLATAGIAYLSYENIISGGFLFEFLIQSPYSFYLILFAELGVVIYLTARLNKMSVTTAYIAFLVYSVINGVTFGVFPLVYDLDTIYMAFLFTALMFGSMAVIGLTTKVDITRFRGLLYGGLIGLIIASILGFLLKLDSMIMVISLFGVALFLALTAYDVQKLKYMHQQNELNPEIHTDKLAIYGALQLYLDFINLFLYILRIMGRGSKK